MVADNGVIDWAEMEAKVRPGSAGTIMDITYLGAHVGGEGATVFSFTLYKQ